MLDLLYSRRSIRKYTGQLVEPEKIDRLIEAALLSPTSKNNKAWVFVPITDKMILKQLSIARPGSAAMLSEAPFAMVVCGNPQESTVWIEDGSIAAIIIQLTAHDIGLGSCWIQIRNRMHNENLSASEYVKRILQLPEHLEVECIISIGYPAESKKKRTKEDLSFDKVIRRP